MFFFFKDPYSAVKLRTVEQIKEDKMTSLPPALEYLWAFSCELTTGWNINSMSLNKMDQVRLKYHICCCFYECKNKCCTPLSRGH